MSDNTALNTGVGGDTLRTIDRTTAKTQVVQIDVGGFSAEALLVATAKGSQGASGVPTQDLKDAGRTYLTLFVDAATGVTSEALATMSINSGGTVTSATSYTVPTGKTLRITSMAATVKASSTTAVYGRARLRAGGTVSTSSGVLCGLDIPLTPGTAAAGAGQSETISFPDGIEVAAGQQVGISQVVSSTSSTVSVMVTGFLY